MQGLAAKYDAEAVGVAIPIVVARHQLETLVGDLPDQVVGRNAVSTALGDAVELSPLTLGGDVDHRHMTTRQQRSLKAAQHG